MIIQQKKLEGYLNFIYLLDGNARNNRYTFTPFLIFSESVNQNRNNQNYILNSQVIKYFPRINLSIKVETNRNITVSYNSIENAGFEPNTNMMNRFLAQGVSTYSGFFNFITGGAWSVMRQKTRTNGIELTPQYFQWQTWLKTTWRFNKKLFITFNTEFNLFESDFGKSSNNIFTDISAQYELQPAKFFLYFDCFNIFIPKLHIYES
ncbi:MAG: hypothetical protein HC817_07050 [Saprospiraceae bacterium]|nr:hypothetical protein [Saprospiraceae bacterium]